MTDEEFRSSLQSTLDDLKKRVAALEEKVAGLEKKVKKKGRAGWYAGQSGR